jgi:hypothetical protein
MQKYIKYLNHTRSWFVYFIYVCRNKFLSRYDKMLKTCDFFQNINIIVVFL